MNQHTIEDYLELLTGHKTSGTFQLEAKDVTILQSIARQVHKGISLTDRQYELLKEKLVLYKDQFIAQGFTQLDLALVTLRMPLRTIDRTKTITVIEDLERKKAFNSIDTKKIPWIKIRFPFAKKTIVLIEEISSIAGPDYYHEKGSHEHYFRCTERNVFKVVNQFKDKNFDIDPQLLEQYGLKYFDQSDVDSCLTNVTYLAKKIALRTKFQVFISNKKYNINQLVEAVLDLYRFPLLVILPTGCQLQQLQKIHRAFDGVVPSDLSSVVFRMDNNDEGREFNNYIKRNNLNNIVDNKTKIVYTDTTKLPKPLLKLNWRPSAVLLLDSFRPNGKVLNFIESSDLIIHYDETPSRFMIRDMDIIE